MISVTGVSGSGKSTLVNEILHKAVARELYGSLSRPGRHEGLDGVDALDKVIAIDQSPIGRTPRSNPATYTKLFDPIRSLFAATTDARARGYKPGRFSFNVKGGRCEACQGAGQIRIEMHFLADVFVTCDVCHGRRYNRETLEVRYKGLDIAEVLDLTVNQALELFANVPKVSRVLNTLVAVGLGYIHLGQPATTLSGGEAQRIKLSRELAKRATGKTLYLLDEPTTGLHFDDVRKLLVVLRALVERGNTVVVIEHNLDVIKTSDWIIDLGPEGGDGGGRAAGGGHSGGCGRLRGLVHRSLSEAAAGGRAQAAQRVVSQRSKVKSQKSRLGKNRVPAVDHEHLAVDHGGVLGTQVDHGVGHVLGAEESAGGGPPSGALEQLLAVGKVEQGVGVHGSRGDGVDPHSLRGELGGEVADHGLEGGLGGADRGVVGNGADRTEGGHGHQHLFPVGRELEEVLGDRQQGGGVDVHRPIEVVHGELAGRLEDARGSV